MTKHITGELYYSSGFGVRGPNLVLRKVVYYDADSPGGFGVKGTKQFQQIRYEVI